MASIIHFTGHGFDAGDAIYFANLVPSDCGIVEGQTYYVLSSNLTLDDFEFSETDGGAAFNFDFDITDGFVGLISTYAPVASGVMAPPEPVPTPTLPTLTSAVVSGIVRLRVDLNDTPEAKIRAWELNVTHKFDEFGDPEWTTPQVITLPESATDFSMPALGETVYAVRLRAQDVYGNFSDWCADQTITTEAGSDALNAALALLSEDVLDGIITETKISDGAISTPKLQAGAVTAEVLAATIVLSSLIKTAEAGGRVELDVDGVRLYNPDEELTVRIPTDGSAAFFKGEVQAANLSNDGLTSLADDVALTGDAIMTLANGVSAPSTPPSLAASLDSLTLTSTPPNLGYGIFYDSHSGGGDTGIPTFWLGANPGVSDYVAHEFNASSGALIRSITKTDTFEQVASTLGSTSHVSDTAKATTGGTDSQVASPLTIPASYSNPIIQKVAVWFTGYSSSVAHRVAVWQGNTLLGTSDTFTPTVEALGVGNSNKQDRYLDPQLAVFPGNTYRFGFLRNSAAGGSQWDRDDGSSKTTYEGDGENGDMTSVTTDTSHKINVSALVLHDVGVTLEGYTGAIIGVVRAATYVWVLEDTGILYQYNESDLTYVAQFSHAANITGTDSKAGMFRDTTSGHLVISTTTGTGAGVQLKFVRVNASTGALVDTLTATGAKTVSGSAGILRGGYHDGTNYWVAVQDAGGTGVYAWDDGTGAYVADRDFGMPANMASGVAFDGTVFRGYAAVSPTKVWKYTAWDWTTASAIYWVGYAWYDPDGTTHETAISPRASLTMRRRERLEIQTPAIPGTGGADEPDNVRIYMLPNATDQAAGSYKLQATDALTSRTLTTYDSGGAADGGGTPFASGSPAQLKSAGTGWILKGSGFINRTGTSFPSSPATGDHYWRSDLGGGMEFFYNGTRWLSTQLFTHQFPVEVTNISADDTDIARSVPLHDPGSDIWYESWGAGYFISGGTALSASHKWSVSIKAIAPGGATTTPANRVIDSGALSTWRRDADADIDALAGDIAVLHLAVAKTGTPGNLYFYPFLTYRIVAT